ncbi:keratin, type II cytoskeletal 8-like [Pholidichthys leucotaenia]
MVRSKELSEATRKKIVDAHESGKGYKKISKEFEISPSTVRSVIRKWKRFETTANKARSGRPSKFSPGADDRMIEAVSNNPKISSRGLQEALATVDVKVHPSTIRKRLQKLGFRVRTGRRKDFLPKKKIEARMAKLTEEFNFFLALYNTELCMLQESLKDTSVEVEMDNLSTLNMDQIVSDVKAQCEDMAACSPEEAETWYKNKFDQMAAQSNNYGNKMCTVKGEMAELKLLITRLQDEIEAVKTQHTSVEQSIAKVEEQGDEDILDAKNHIKDLEQALQKVQQDMALQLKDYQELMNVKLVLDIEIATYKKLLEGEKK